MKEQTTRRVSRGCILLLVLCALFALLATGCGKGRAEQNMTPDADKDPLKTISTVLMDTEMDSQLFGTVSNIRKSGSSYTADMRVYEWTEGEEGRIVLTDTEDSETITMDGKTTVVYATNSDPHGTVMTAEQFQTAFNDGDTGVFAVCINKDGKVALIYSYSLVEKEE